MERQFEVSEHLHVLINVPACYGEQGTDHHTGGTGEKDHGLQITQMNASGADFQLRVRIHHPEHADAAENIERFHDFPLFEPGAFYRDQEIERDGINAFPLKRCGEFNSLLLCLPETEDTAAADFQPRFLDAAKNGQPVFV
jgi:hypothetical protein